MMHSPLRYPGGKSDFLLVAKQIVEKCGLVGLPIVEPYAGSAAVSLGLLDFGLTSHVTLLERDPLLYSFWKCVFTRTADLIVKFQELPITLKSWEGFQELLKLDKPDDARLLECGVAALFLNRANFSGILNAGPIGGKGQKSQYKIDCRTNKDDIISRILALSMLADSVDVRFGDAVELIHEKAKTKNCFFYLDPPYFNKGEMLYRHFYKLKQHKALSEALQKAKFKWLLSYDDHQVIEYLYEDFNILRQPFRYSAHSPKNHDELLISNFLIAEDSVEVKLLPRRQRHSSPSKAQASQPELI